MIFFAKIGIFCKSIADPLPSIVQACTQPFSFGGRIKLIICQNRHELSVTIHESKIWHRQSNVDKTAQVNNFFFQRSDNEGLRFFLLYMIILFKFEVVISKITKNMAKACVIGSNDTVWIQFVVHSFETS